MEQISIWLGNAVIRRTKCLRNEARLQLATKLQLPSQHASTLQSNKARATQKLMFKFGGKMRGWEGSKRPEICLPLKSDTKGFKLR